MIIGALHPTPGVSIGPYRILRKLGAGGMGEVYRAHDTRIGRDVALKVLRGHQAADTDRLRRFEQEARAVGALNHPNVLTLHDVGRHDGTPYIVSELLEGETLRAAVLRGPLGAGRAVDYARQIARGLAAAHDKGIVHRDLKPENVFVTRDGRVKILDFGLARLVEPEPADAAAEAETAVRHTEAGAVLGTAGFMSPEQVRGQPADHRSDVFSFGAILYEMLTGRRAFDGETAVQAMNAVLATEPPPIERADGAASILDRIVRRCLAKAPEERFQSAHDLGFALEALPGAAVPAPPRSRERSAWVMAGAALAIGAAAAAGTMLALRRQPAAAPEPLRRTTILPPDDTRLMTGTAKIALSPDGTHIAFLARNREGRIWLWIRGLSELVPRAVAETDVFASPFWSADGRELGFAAGGRLKRMDVATGAVQQICDVARNRGATWNRDGTIVFAPLPTGPLYRVAASGGATIPATRLDTERGEVSHRWPSFLPDGRHFLFLATARAGEQQSADLYLGTLDSEERRLLVRDASNAEYAPSGHLVFGRQGSLLAVPFDAERLAVTGEPLVVSREVVYFKPSESLAFSTSADGALAYLTAPATESRLAWLDRAGNVVGTVEERDHALVGKVVFGGLFRLSPDGGSVAFTRLDRETSNGQVWVYDLGRGTSTRVTTEPMFYNGIAWAPAGRRLAFAAVQTNDIREKVLGGTGQENVLLELPLPTAVLDWSRDGRYVLYRQLDPKTGWDLWALPLDGPRKPLPLARTRFNEQNARVSPDGRWMAFTGNESGRPDVYVQAFPDGNQKWLVSTAGGRDPVWRNDGRELFYYAPDGKLMAVAVKPGDGFEFAAARPLFAFPAEAIDFERFDYDVAPDGQRFLVHLPQGREAPPSITLVTNWPAALPR